MQGDSIRRTPSVESQRSLDSSFDEILIAPSIGSFGHPEMCSRPCVYFTWGPCPKVGLLDGIFSIPLPGRVDKSVLHDDSSISCQAAYCGFCHLAHRESTGKLDKRLHTRV